MAKEDNFYSYLNGGKEAVAMDKMPKKKKGECYTIFCRDAEGTLKRLIEAIGKHGNGGHTYDIVLDPDLKEEREVFCWDGDGSDRIYEIIDTTEMGENPVIRMCLQTLDSINMMAKEIAREKEEYGVPPPSTDEKKHKLDDIIHDSHLLLNGANYEDNCKRKLETIRDYCKIDIEGLKDGRIKDLTVQEVLEHIKEIAEEGLEKGITFNA